ncbi:hypothetical protein GCM10017774_21570 [Lentzea cavernae]|uniref:Helix-turn-helix domain-containing protein n=1 Tax=Lentzea cavernae TaxID=2020703 RepID=A0ABQ3M9U4_9PSEU|nr:hypothetical protein GCM10017774_21570 [Lentzea cavernae]
MLVKERNKDEYLFTPININSHLPHLVLPQQGHTSMSVDPTEAGTESARQLRRLVELSKRAGIQLPREFVRSAGSDRPPPLAKMIRGGRGGEVRLKLYLSLTLIAVKAPYGVRQMAGRSWASALALPAPESRGARRIGDALNWLCAEKLIALERDPARPPRIAMLSPVGDGTAYERPGSRYTTLTTGFWTNQWITVLSSSAVALLLVLLDLQGGEKEQSNAPWLAGDQWPRYGISPDTRTRATKELQRAGLLTVSRVPQGKEFDYLRLRNTYWVHKERLEEPAELRS